MAKHCWADAWGDHEVGSPEYLAARLAWPRGGTCLLPDGHDGPHEFTPDDQIFVIFAPFDEPPSRQDVSS